MLLGLTDLVWHPLSIWNAWKWLAILRQWHVGASEHAAKMVKDHKIDHVVRPYIRHMCNEWLRLFILAHAFEIALTRPIPNYPSNCRFDNHTFAPSTGVFNAFICNATPATIVAAVPRSAAMAVIWSPER